MNFKPLIKISFLLVLLSALFVLRGELAQAQDCRDALGAPIACPGTSAPATDDQGGEQPSSNDVPPSTGQTSDQPAPEATEAPASEEASRPGFPNDGLCYVATRGAEAVNVRKNPSFESEIIASLNPQLFYQVEGSIETPDGTWYKLASGGYIFGGVVRSSGPCGVLKPRAAFIKFDGIKGSSFTAAQFSPSALPEDCPFYQRCVIPGRFEFANAEETEIEHFCTEEGICIGGLVSPLPDPRCESLSCFNVLLWLPSDVDPETGGIDMLAVWIGLEPDSPVGDLWQLILQNPNDPNPQTREHILLARQVNVPVQDPAIPLPVLELLLGPSDPQPIGLLLPAVQKVRSAGLFAYDLPQDESPFYDEARLAWDDSGSTEFQCIDGVHGDRCICQGFNDCLNMLLSGACNNTVASACSKTSESCMCLIPNQ